MDQATADPALERLLGAALPRIPLPSTRGGLVDLAAPHAPRTVVYCYPRTSEPGKPAPAGWDSIPGARGCTPQACSFRDHHRDLAALGAAVFGLSTQPTAYQQEMAARLQLPFAVLSDERFMLTDALGLPTFEVEGMRLIRRLTLVIRDGIIEAVFHPVRQPERNAAQVAEWLESNPLR